MVVSVKRTGTYQNNGEDQIGGKKHHPKLYPASNPNPPAPSVRQSGPTSQQMLVMITGPTIAMRNLANSVVSDLNRHGSRPDV
jgi:hypothetical protein